MEFAKLNYEYFERKRKRRNVAILIIAFIPYFVSMFFVHNFWWYLVLMTYLLLFSVVTGVFSILPWKQNPYRYTSPLKLLFSRIALAGVGAFGLFILAPSTVALYKDAPIHYRGEYIPIVGKARLETMYLRSGKKQRLVINDTEYESFYILDEKYNGRFIRVHYLPHSRYVIDIMTRN